MIFFHEISFIESIFVFNRIIILIVQINGVNIENSRHDQVVSLLTGSSGEVHLVVQREKLATVPAPSMVHAPLPNSGMSTPLKIQTAGVHQQIVNVDDISPLAQSSPLLPHYHKPNSTAEFFIEVVNVFQFAFLLSFCKNVGYNITLVYLFEGCKIGQRKRTAWSKYRRWFRSFEPPVRRSRTWRFRLEGGARRRCGENG